MPKRRVKHSRWLPGQHNKDLDASTLENNKVISSSPKPRNVGSHETTGVQCWVRSESFRGAAALCS